MGVSREGYDIESLEALERVVWGEQDLREPVAADGRDEVVRSPVDGRPRELCSRRHRPGRPDGSGETLDHHFAAEPTPALDGLETVVRLVPASRE